MEEMTSLLTQHGLTLVFVNVLLTSAWTLTALIKPSDASRQTPDAGKPHKQQVA